MQSRLQEEAAAPCPKYVLGLLLMQPRLIPLIYLFITGLIMTFFVFVDALCGGKVDVPTGILPHVWGWHGW